MRTWFLVLVAANLAYFAWTQYGSPDNAGTDPEPLARQIEPAKLKIVPPPAIGAPAAAVSATATCLEWGSFSVNDAARVEPLLAPFALGPRLAQRRAEETAQWWVYLPPQGGRQAALRRVEELKKLGVEEFFILQEEGRWRWAVSLGVFRSEDAARARLLALQGKKVRGAQVGPRTTQVTRVWFQVRDVDTALRDKLGEITQGAPGTELRDCPAAG